MSSRGIHVRYTLDTYVSKILFQKFKSYQFHQTTTKSLIISSEDQTIYITRVKKNM